MADVRDVNLNRLVVFVAVVESGSLTRGAERLGLAKTMVSKHMQRLEAEVGASLLTRTTRQLTVTEAGKAFYEASLTVLRAAEAGLAAIATDAGPLRGTLKVSAPIDFAAMFVTPALIALRREHPALHVELDCSDHFVDLVDAGIDVAIRLGRLADSNNRVVRIGEFVSWLVASPTVVAAHGTPTTPAMIGTMPYIALSGLPQPGLLVLESRDGRKHTVRCANPYLTNAAIACRAATLAGGGCALLTDFSVADDVASGRLVRLLGEWHTAPADIQAVFPPTRFPSRKVRALIDAVRAQWHDALARLPDVDT